MATPCPWDDSSLARPDDHEPLTTPYGLDALDALQPQPGQHLLEVACGGGRVAHAATERGLRVTAVDASPRMIAATRTHAPAADARVMDGQRLDLPDDSVDLALSVFGVILFDDTHAGLAELQRVLRPGGVAAVVSWASPAAIGHLALWQDALHEVYPDAAGLPSLPGCLALEGPVRITDTLARAGFAHIEVRPLHHTWRPASLDLVLGIDRNPVFQSVYRAIAPDAEEHVRRGFRRRLSERFAERPLEIPAQAWLALARNAPGVTP